MVFFDLKQASPFFSNQILRVLMIQERKNCFGFLNEFTFTIFKQVVSQEFLETRASLQQMHRLISLKNSVRSCQSVGLFLQVCAPLCKLLHCF